MALLGVSLCVALAPRAWGETPGEALAESERWSFEHLTTADGLPHDVVYSLLQDDLGFLWVGCEDGLGRYDGYAFETWEADPGETGSLAHSDVSHLIQDRDGMLWLATWGGGLDRLDPRSGEIVHHPGRPGSDGGLQDSRVQRVLEDAAGTLWVGTFVGGLARYDPASGRFETFRHRPDDPSSLPDDRVWALAQDALGILWIGTGGGLAFYDPAAGALGVVDGGRVPGVEPGHGAVRALHVDRRGNLWVGTSRGLARLERTARTLTPVALPGGGTEPINAILEDSGGEVRGGEVRGAKDRGGALWVGTGGGGLVRCDAELASCRRFRHDPRDPRALSHDDVRVLYEDRAQNLWIGTRGGGLDKLDLKPRKFPHVGPRDGGEAAQLSDPRVRGFAEDARGRLWVATAGGLDRYDPETGGFVHYRHDPGAPQSLPDNHLHHLLVDRADTLWVGVWKGGLARHLGEGRFERFRHDPRDPESLVDDGVIALLEDHQGALWVATVGGLARLGPERRRFTAYRHQPGDERSLSESYVRALGEDATGHLWAGTDGGGLNRLDPEGGFVRHRHRPGDSASLPNDRVHAIYQQPGGALWIGTDGGLAQHLGDGRFRSYRERDGLPSDRVVSLVADDRGVLWIATNRGLARFEPASDRWRAYDLGDGLQGHRYIPGSVYRDGSGLLYFGGENGFNVFDPAQVVDNPHPPPLALTAVRLQRDGVTVEEGAPALERLELGPGDGALEIEFAALDLTAPESNRYRYRLEGHDPDWIDAGGGRRAVYGKLDPGSYVFRVQGSNGDGAWNRNGLALPIAVEPAPWDTPWFWLLAILALATLVFGAHRLQVRSLRRRERQLEERLEAGLADLKRSEERFRRLFERNLAGVVRATADGRILDCNEAFARILGYDSPEECRRQRLDASDDGERLGALLSELRERGQLVNHEHQLRARDGSLVSLLWNVHLHAGEGGTEVLEGTVVDVSERRRIEESLRRSQKLQSLAVLAGGIAHDFNNLLTAVLGHAELARFELPKDSPVGERLSEIEEAARKAAALAKQMLAFSGQGRYVVEPLDLSRAIEGMAKLLERAVSKKVVLEYRLADDLPPISADRSQMGEMLVNLLANASEAIDDQAEGRIVVTTGATRLDRADLPEADLDEDLEPGPYVVLEVRDDGCGMDRATRGRVFEPFFTTKFTGRGLGLAAVHGIVRGHGGAVDVTSEPGRGTTVRVLFPAAQPAESATAAAVAAPRDAPWRGSGVILVVDDDESVRVVGRDMAELMGFEVLTARDGQEGVELFRRHDGKITAVVLDLAMPRLSGVEAFQEMHKTAPHVPVLLATGYDEQETTEKFADQGFAGFLQKPFRLSQLRQKLRQILEP